MLVVFKVLRQFLGRVFVHVPDRTASCRGSTRGPSAGYKLLRLVCFNRVKFTPVSRAALLVVNAIG
jgi:hypothetical protein